MSNVRPLRPTDPLGPDSMSRHGCCAHCGESAHSIGAHHRPSDAIHTHTGLFHCGTGGTTAELITFVSVEQARQDGYDHGAQDAQSGAEDARKDGMDEGRTEGVAIGRREALAEVRQVVKDAREREFGAVRADEHGLYPRPVYDVVPVEVLDQIERVLNA